MVSYFFIACGEVHKSGDEKLVTVYDINNMIQIQNLLAKCLVAYTTVKEN